MHFAAAISLHQYFYTWLHNKTQNKVRPLVYIHHKEIYVQEIDGFCRRHFDVHLRNVSLINKNIFAAKGTYLDTRGCSKELQNIRLRNRFSAVSSSEFREPIIINYKLRINKIIDRTFWETLILLIQNSIRPNRTFSSSLKEILIYHRIISHTKILAKSQEKNYAMRITFRR